MRLFIPILACGRAGQFSPLQITGCVLWLKADQINLTDGAAVGTWTDQSTAANSCTQSTVANKPVYHTNVINGLPAVQFDGIAQYMSFTSTGAFVLPFSAFVVIRPTADTSAQISYATVLENGGGNNNGCFIAVKLTASVWGTFTNADLSSGNALTSANNYLLETTGAASSTFLYQKGVQVATSATSESGGSGGLGSNPLSSRWYKGYIAEAIVYNTVLSSPNRISVENYLISKYAL